MRTLSSRLFLLVFAATAAGGQAVHALDAATVRKGKEATVLVDLKKGTGSAFCISTKGFFITNRHVVKAGERGGKIKLVLRASETTQKILEAEVVREDEDSDLALLKTTGDVNAPVLTLGDDSRLTETMEVTAFGYPFGKALATDEGDYPAVSVNSGRVTSIRKKKNEVYMIQIDAEVNPGNSGGPLLNAEGKVVGVIVAGIYGTAVNFAIPSSCVQRFLAKPSISFVPPVLGATNIHTAVKFSVQAVSMFATDKPFSVQLELKPGDMDAKIYDMKPGLDGYYTASPVIVPSSRDVKQVNLSADFGDSTIKCSTPDAAVRVGATRVMLSEISEIKGGSAGRVTKADGTVLEGKISSDAGIRTTVGGTAVTMDLSKAVSATLFNPELISSVQYTIRVRQGDTILDETQGAISIGGGAKKSLPDVLQKSLVLYLPFDKDEGGKASDRSGKEARGVVSGAKWESSGKRGGAMRFGGSQDIVTVNSDPLKFDSESKFTLSAWIMPQAPSSWDGREYMGLFTLSARSGGDGSFSYRMSLAAPTDKASIPLEFVFGGFCTQNGTPIVSSVSPGKWQHVAAVYERGNISFYLNGEKKKSISSTIGGLPKCDSFTTNIGNDVGNPGSRGFNGLIDEVMIFNEALTAEQIKASLYGE